MSSIRRTAARSVAGTSARWRSRRRVGARQVGVLAGYGFLVWTLVIVLFLDNGWLPIWTAAAAAALLSLDRRLGPLPAAMLLMLAIPVGRGAEVGLPRLPGTDIPVRMHDAIALLGITGALPAVLRGLRHPGQIDWRVLVPVGLFVAVGIMALAIGVVGDQAMRDVVRDARWWAFYAIGLVALLAGTRRPAIMRALMWGLTLYSAVILIGLLMPAFHGGLKWYAYSYDPRMRLHYGQAIFLLVAAGFLAHRVTRVPSLPAAALLGLMAAAIGVTLTRTLLAGIAFVAVLAALAAAYAVIRPTRAHLGRSVVPIARRAAPAVLATAIGLSAGFGAYWVGVRVWEPLGAVPETGSGSNRGQPTDTRPVLPTLNRVFEDTASTGASAQSAGRLTSYGLAFADTARSPVLGRGMGTLARVPWAWGGFRAYTEGSQPGVDNAYLTIGLKAGAIGIATFAAMMLWPLRLAWRQRRFREWFIPAWLAIAGLTLIQSFAVSGYAPFALVLLLLLPAIGRRRGALTPVS